MKFVALFALFCLASGSFAANVDHAPVDSSLFDLEVMRDMLAAKSPQRHVREARDFPTHEEASAAAHGHLENLNVEVLPEDRRNTPLVRQPAEELDLGGEVSVESELADTNGEDEAVHENRRTGNGLGATHDNDHETTTPFEVITTEVTATTEAGATSVPVTDKTTTSGNTEQPEKTTAAPETAKPEGTTAVSGETTTVSGNTDKPEGTTDATTDSTGTDSTGTDSTGTDSTGTEIPTTEPTQDQKKGDKKGLSTASISAIVIGGVLALAVVVAVAMAIVRRRRAQHPERRGILDA